MDETTKRQIERDNYDHLDRKYQRLLAEVRRLEGCMQEILERCEGERDSGYGYIHGIAAATLGAPVAGGADK